MPADLLSKGVYRRGLDNWDTHACIHPAQTQPRYPRHDPYVSRMQGVCMLKQVQPIMFTYALLPAAVPSCEVCRPPVGPAYLWHFINNPFVAPWGFSKKSLLLHAGALARTLDTSRRAWKLWFHQASTQLDQDLAELGFLCCVIANGTQSELWVTRMYARQYHQHEKPQAL